MSGAGRTRMELIETNAIRFRGAGWDAYFTRYMLDATALEDSVRQSGVVEPITVEEFGLGYRLVSGFRRAAAARIAGTRTVPAVIYEEGALQPREAYLAALAANATGTGFSDADRATALKKACREFGFDETELISIIAPLVGLPQSRKVVREYIEIAELPDVALSALAAGEKSREHASALLQVAPADREWFWREIVEVFRLSASETRLVAGGAGDLAARDGRAMRDTVAELAASAKGESMSAAETKARLKDALARRLSPVLTEMEDEFAALAGSLGLPPGATVEHSQSFETDEITLKAQADDAETFERLRDAIARGLAAGTIEKMLTVARRKTAETAERLKEG